MGAGPEAKAILFYITDYITKSQLPTHAAYSIMEAAVRKIDVLSTSPDHSDIVAHAKLLMRKCANSLIAHQELSSHQVSSSLLGHGAKYASHSFQHLYWPSFERYLESVEPTGGSMPPINEGRSATILDAEYGDQISLTEDGGRLIPKNTQVADYIYRPHVNLILILLNEVYIDIHEGTSRDLLVGFHCSSRKNTCVRENEQT